MTDLCSLSDLSLHCLLRFFVRILRINVVSLLCSDVNECEETPGVCDQICVNRYGSYRCRCRPGYRRLSRGRCRGKYHYTIVAVQSSE